MNLDKTKLLDLFNQENYTQLKLEIEKSSLDNKKEILSALASIQVTASDLALYNGLIMKYGEFNIAEEIMKNKNINRANLLKEIYKTK